MFYKTIILFFIALSLYTIVPTLYNKFINRNIIRNFQTDNIYLTFDDGPDIQFTNQLLDILSKYHIKATFFLVATKTLENKSIVERIISEGHSIGTHSYNHKSSWLMTPSETKSDFTQSLAVLSSFDYPVSLYRPPWGMFNALTYYYATSFNLNTVLWTTSVKYLKINSPVDYIVNNVIENIKPGDILLFHDSGGDKSAPANTLLAMDILIPTLLEKGYSFDKI